MATINKFSESDCKQICSILKEYCSGSEITTFLKDLNFYDIQIQSSSQASVKYSKADRLTVSVMKEQLKYNNGSPLIQLIEKIYNPIRFIGTQYNWEVAKLELNTKSQFWGFELDDSGKIIKSTKVTTYAEAEIRYNSLKSRLLSNNIHHEVLKYCKAEYLEDNYFHCILEASKALFDKIRSISTLDLDGNILINTVFNEKSPIVVFNSLRTSDERNEYLGFKYLLKSITCLFRNPTAHNPKIYSITTEEDALMTLNIISFAFKQLDLCSLNSYSLKKHLDGRS